MYFRVEKELILLILILKQFLREDVSNYVADKVKRVETFANETWENAKDIAEEGLKLVIEAKQSIAQTVQDAG